MRCFRCKSWHIHFVSSLLSMGLTVVVRRQPGDQERKLLGHIPVHKVSLDATTFMLFVVRIMPDAIYYAAPDQVNRNPPDTGGFSTSGTPFPRLWHGQIPP